MHTRRESTGRSANTRDLYRTVSLQGRTCRKQGRYFHDGRFATLGDVVDLQHLLQAAPRRRGEARPRRIPEVASGEDMTRAS